MLNNRQLKILDILNKEKRMGIKDIAILMNVSYKTIQNDINYINEKLGGINEKIVIKTNVGLSFYVENESQFNEFVNKQKEKLEEYSYENNDFVILLLTLLSINKEIKKSDFIEQYYLSSSKMSAILEETRLYLTRYQLTLSYRKNLGIYLEGEENNIRNLMIDILFMLEKSNKKKTLSLFYENYYEIKSDLNVFVSELFKIYDYKITYDAKESFLLAMITMLVRNRTKNVFLSGKEVDYSIENLYELASNIKISIEKKLDVKLNDDEVNYIYQLLNGVKKRHDKSVNNIDSSKCLYIDNLVSKVLKRIDQKYTEDFSNNLELYSALFLHLYSLIERIESNFKINNPLLSDIVKSYPLACDMALEVSVIVEKEFDVILDNNEVGYLAIYFNLAIEQKKQKIMRKKVLVVSSSGGGLLNMLEMKIRNQFYKNIESIETCELVDIETKDLNSYDYIFTTIPLDIQNANTKIISIPNLFNQISLENMPIDLNERKNRMVDLIDRKIFYTDIPGDDKESVLKGICERITNTLHVDEDLYGEVIARERLFSTELENLIAFPHPLEYSGNISFVSFTVLDRQIKWNNLNVQVIIMIALAKKDRDNAQDFYSDFTLFVNDKKRVLNLIKEPSFDNLVEQVNFN